MGGWGGFEVVSGGGVTYGLAALRRRTAQARDSEHKLHIHIYLYLSHPRVPLTSSICDGVASTATVAAAAAAPRCPRLRLGLGSGSGAAP